MAKFSEWLNGRPNKSIDNRDRAGLAALVTALAAGVEFFSTLKAGFTVTLVSMAIPTLLGLAEMRRQKRLMDHKDGRR